MNPPPRRVATPLAPPLSHKRKERNHFKPPPPRYGSAHAAKSALSAPLSNSAKQARLFDGSAFSSNPAPSPHPQAAKPNCNNLLIAGYMANEFLTKGTILGEQIDPTRAAVVPEGSMKTPSRSIQTSRKADERYAEVASLLKTDGAHISGIVNPTQLVSYLTGEIFKSSRPRGEK
ncbi:unnamed protein product [Rhodiola kirilowii]